MKRSFDKLVWREVVFQRPFEVEEIFNLLTHLSGLTRRKQLVWEIRGNGKGKVKYLIGMEESDEIKIKKIFNSHAITLSFSNSTIAKRKDMTLAKELKITHRSLSLKTTDITSMTRASLACLASLTKNEEMCLQVIVGASSPPKPVRNDDLVDPTATVWQIICGNLPPISPENKQLLKEKQKYSQFQSIIRLGIASGSPKREQELLQLMLSSLRIIESSGARISLKSTKNSLIGGAHTPWHYPLRLSARELGCFWLTPFDSEELPGVSSVTPKLNLPPLWLKSSAPRAFGCTVTGGHSNEIKELAISEESALHHTILTAPSGSGKSNILLTLANDDCSKGRSLLLIDPKTDLVNDLLERLPEHRKNDVVVIDPSSPRPVGFNPFSLVDSGISPELVADSILAVFKDIYKDSWGIHSQDVLSNALLTLARTKNASLIMLPPLLTDKSFRDKILKSIDDPLGVEPFWQNFENLSKGEKTQLIAPVLNKTRQFLLLPQLRNTVCQLNSSFSLTDLFFKRKIILVKLNKGVIGAETAKMIGSLLVGLTWTFALKRTEIRPEKRHFISIMIDELQDYLRLPTDLSDALSQSRGLGIGLTLSHQYRHQLDSSKDLQAGIDANCKNKICFGLEMADANQMAKLSGGALTANDFNKLPKYHLYANLLVDGKMTGWLSGKSYPPAKPIRELTEIYNQSMQNYGRDIKEIEAEFMELLGFNSPKKAPAPIENIGRKRRKES